MIGARVGHIRITGVLGEGGMGEVYRGIDERLDRPVALKAIRAERRLSPEARARFLREARLLSSLDHTGICRIHEYIEAEAGDFLVLELVEGVTLERAIAAGMSRARKLRVAIEIADALAAAHRKGIVHRDLKPENVMIASDGKVKVLDFGVARQQAETERASGSMEPDTIDTAETLIFALDGPAAPASDNVPVTAHGIAVGTPAFMSPEQATGRGVTPASDMYAFGLVLQTLFTEKEPHPIDIYAMELMTRAAAGVSDPVVGQPRDLAHLIERLKSKAPADRPTAVEALSILRRIVEKPRRRMRYAALAFVLALAIGFAVKYVTDVTAARRDAERRRRQAEELVSFMVGDLRSKLEAVGRLDALDGAASRALAYFQSLSAEELTGGDLHKNALALAQLGDVRMNEGKFDEAVKLFEESLRFANAAVARDPKNEEWQLALSNAHFWAGEASRQKGDHAQTLAHFRAYLDISERLAARHPGNAKYEAEVSYGHGNVGAAHEATGNVDAALAEYLETVELDRRRVARDPATGQWQEDLATSLNRAAVMLQNTGRLSAARDAFEEELALRRRLAGAHPRDARHLTNLATCLAHLSSLRQLMGDGGRALDGATEELELSTRLAELDPSNVNRRRNRAAAQIRLAGLLTSDLPRALALARSAETELRELARQDPLPGRRRDLAATILVGGTLAFRAGDLASAKARAGEVLAIVEALAAAGTPHVSSARLQAEALLLAADVDERLGGDGTVVTRYRERAAALTGADLRNPRTAALHIRALRGLGKQREAAPLEARLLATGFRDPYDPPSAGR